MAVDGEELSQQLFYNINLVFSESNKPLTYRIAPETIPEQPIPEIARPMMKQLEAGATADSSDPTSNIPIAHRKTVFVVATL